MVPCERSSGRAQRLLGRLQVRQCFLGSVVQVVIGFVAQGVQRDLGRSSTCEEAQCDESLKPDPRMIIPHLPVREIQRTLQATMPVAQQARCARPVVSHSQQLPE